MKSFILAVLAIIGVCCLHGISADDKNYGGYYSQQMTHMSYPVPVPYAASAYGGYGGYGYGAGGYGAGSYGAQGQFSNPQTNLLAFLLLLPVLLGIFNNANKSG